MDKITLAISSILCMLVFIIPLRDRLSGKAAVPATLFVQLALYTALYRESLLFSLPVIVLSQLLSFSGCLIIFSGELLFRIYIGVWVSLLQGFLPELWRLIYSSLLWHRLSEQQANEGSVLYILFALLMLLLFSRLIPLRIYRDELYRIGPRQTVSALLVLLLFDIMLYHSPLSIEAGEAERLILTQVLAELYCISFLYLQYTMFRESAVERELIAMNLLALKQREQYELSKENIALINRKTHDLKHQVRALREMDDSSERGRYLDEIDDSIGIYESIVKTGSEVLDVILTEKSLLCREKGIEIHCVADGSRLSFMDAVDIYSVFGNIIDNAIEEVQSFREREKRQIDVLIYVQQSFLLINVLNPLKKELEFQDELPRTTKADEGYHGFGLRSVKHTVRSYGGNMTIRTEDGVFSIKILLPLPEE